MYLYLGWLLIKVEDVQKQEELIQKSRIYVKGVARLHSVCPNMLRVPAMTKAAFLPKNRLRLFLIMTLTLAIAVPPYYWPLAVGGAPHISDIMWVQAQFICKPVSFILHLFAIVTTARSLGKKTFFLGVGLFLLLFGNIFLQLCLSVLVFLD